MIGRIEHFFTQHKKPIKFTYITIIVLAVIWSIYHIWVSTSWSTVWQDFSRLTLSKSILIIILGAISVIPMVIYDFTYIKKTGIKIGWLRLLKNSYIINTFTNAGGAGGLTGATLRVYLLGKPSRHMTETAKVVAQIALFTLIGLVTNDLFAMLLNIKQLSQMPLIMQLSCFLFLLYIFVPFFIPNKSLNFHDHLMLSLGSSLEWLFALGFFLTVGFLMGYQFNLSQAYLAVCFAGIIGAITLIPGGLGTFDSAIILGLHQLGISTTTAVTWALIYRVCYYIIPFIIGIIFFAITVIHKKLTK